MDLDTLLAITKAIGAALSATRNPETMMLANTLFLHCKRIHQQNLVDDREALRHEALDLISALEAEDQGNAAEFVKVAMGFVVDLHLDD